MKRVAFDEAGNTGANLLDIDQPVFVLASVVDDEAVRGIVAKGEQELKFSRLRRSARGRRKILRILNDENLDSDRVMLSGFHKRFMVVTKIVDLLYEPLAYAHGIDLYERGGNLALANLLYHTLPVFAGHEQCERILETFVAMIRDASDDSTGSFYEAVAQAYQAGGENLGKELGPLMASRPVAEAYRSQFHHSDLDPAIPAFVHHASEWTGRLEEPFEIVHDASKALEQEEIVLEAMMSVTEESTPIGYDRRKMKFPITATGIRFANSADVAGVQIADIIASSAAYVSKDLLSEGGCSFARELLETRVLSGEWAPVWPELKVTPADLRTDEAGPDVDPHEYLGRYVSDRLGGIPPAGQRKKPKGSND